MTAQITELCLVSEDGLAPFAVLVEQGDQCAWATGGDFGGRIHPSWAGHVLGSKARRPQEWWVLAAWRDWLATVAWEAPAARRQTLAQIERSTPGVVIKRPRVVRTRLPVAALAAQWRRLRLHDRAEVIGSEIASRLEGLGAVHWSAEVVINDYRAVSGDWVVVMGTISDDPRPDSEGTRLWADDLTRLPGITVIRVISAHEVEAVKAEWARSKAELGADHPYGIAIVRHRRQAEATALGCIVGARFPAAVSLAVAAARGYQRGV